MYRTRHTITALVLALALLPGSVSALPADSSDTATPEGFVQAELQQGLTSDSVARQEQAMRRIRAYAHTQLYDAGLFDDLVRPLHDLVANGETVHVRLMALSALDAIGSDAAMAGLQVQKDGLESTLVRETAETVLARHTGTRPDETPARTAE